MLHEKASKYIKVVMLVFVLYFLSENGNNYGIFEKNFRYAIFAGFYIFFMMFLISEEKNRKGKIYKILKCLLLVLFICMVGVKIYDFNVCRRVDKLCNHIEFNFNNIKRVKVEKVTPESDRKSAPDERITDDKDKINYLKNYICSMGFTKVKGKSRIKDEKYLKEQMFFCISFINNKYEDSNDNRLILEIFPNKIIVKGIEEDTIYYSVEKVLNKELLWKFYDGL